MLKKQTAHEVKNLDEKEGVVEAYANVYNVEDSDGDISMPGSFKKTVKEQRERIRVLKDHNSWVSLGVPMKLDAEDPVGLRTVTKFNLEKEVSRDMFSDIQLMMEHKLNPELSIGYEVQKRNEKDERKIEEFKLYEYSFLTGWAANSSAIVQEVKNLKSKPAVIDMLTTAYDLKYSDPTLQKIETLLKSLDSGEPPEESDTPDIEPIKGAFDTLLTKIELENDQLWTLKN